VQVYQGERPIAAQNRLLGRFDLTGIPPAPRGMPQIEVTFDIDANGILKVQAKDKATGKESKIEIKSDSGLSKDEIERMKKEAASNEADDKKRLEIIHAKNEADKLIYGIESMLRDGGDKITADERKECEEKKKELEEANKTDDVARIKAGVEALTKVSHAIAGRMYGQGGQSQQQGPGGAAGGNFNRGGSESEKKDEGGKDKVVDADFSVK
jgi:molecular chaperone DnaK